MAVMAAKERAAILFALATLVASPAAFASIARSGLFDPQRIERPALASGESLPFFTPHDRDALLAANRVSIEVARLEKTRVWASPVRTTLLRQETSELNRALRRTYEPLRSENPEEIRLYEVPDLYLAASATSVTHLFTGFHAAPFVEPANGMAYFRNRWFDPESGTWLTADPMGTRDSSNQYAGFGADPVNRRDPNGNSATAIGAVGGLIVGAGYALSSEIGDCFILDECKDTSHYLSQIAQFGIVGAEIGASLEFGGVGGGSLGATLGGAGFGGFGAAKTGDWATFGRHQAVGAAGGLALWGTFRGAGALLSLSPTAGALGNRILSSGIARWSNNVLSTVTDYLGRDLGDVAASRGVSRALAPAQQLIKTSRRLGALARYGSQYGTAPDTAFFWSGRTSGIGGDLVAAKIAQARGGTTLEMLIERRGIKLPPWDPSDPAVIAAWDGASSEYSGHASGLARGVIGDSLRAGNTWERTELPVLRSSPRVTAIIRIDPATLIESPVPK